MSTNRAPASGVFGPYTPEQIFERPKVDVVYCTRCKTQGRATIVQFTPDAIGRLNPRCPLCDGVRTTPRKAHPDEILKPQALIGKAQLLPPCPPGKLRCQCCAWPVEGDERLCVKCSLPGLSKSDRAKLQREREDAEAAAAPPRPRPTLPKPLFPHGQILIRREAPDLARAVRKAERKQRPAAKQKAPSLRTCTGCGATSRHTNGPREISSCIECRPPVMAPGSRAPLQFKPKPCAFPGCGEMFQPTGGRSRHCPAHS